MKLLTAEDARARMLARTSPLGAERATLANALGRVLAEPVVADRDQPPFAASAMDGWAVRAADTPGRLAITGESAAGRGFQGELGPGQAVRIFTGAPIPAGADAVAIQEDVERAGDVAHVPATPPGKHVRPAGLDFRTGQRLLEPGVRLDPWRLALAAGAGRASLSVARRPRVTVLATGEEIVRPGRRARADQIFDSGSTALTALVRACGGEARALPAAGDTVESILASVSRDRGELLVTLGGASVGDHDLVKPALSRLGLELAVESVAVRPGKPTWFGVLANGRAVLGLPGNPASALVCAELFLRPLLNAMLGLEPGPKLERARAAAPLEANGAREHWMRAKLLRDESGRTLVEPLSDQDSSLLTAFAMADALLRRVAGAPAARAGESVEILPLARLGHG